MMGGMGSRGEGPETLGEAVRLLAAEVEGHYGVPIEVVVVGDCVLDEKLNAQMQAMCEAMTNAAKHGGKGGAVQVYAEVEGRTVFVSVRDRGPGFDLDSIPADRMGVRESIIGRMQRNGGTARLRAVPEGGTEVELEMDRVQGDASSNGMTWLSLPSGSGDLVWSAVVARQYREAQREEEQTRQRERVRRLRRVRKAVGRAEACAVAGLFALAVVGYVISAFATRSVLESIQHGQFSPSDTAQIITAIGGLTTAVGLSIAAVLKALALLVHARADMVRARESLPPGEGAAVSDEAEPTT
ncbi:adenosylcobinamide amidohydrolase [Streptomyces griseochromogenes]|uniref:Adenosylcobinamide amidohydrolase n=2 Tax=Streptomyces griseochromogenes TaxID=68214 RepID=A0ABS4M0M7_9ACTN|nr:adenosylcobinamide amidohydrolase [Streptomyces griseochromogenes]